jgi:hypothetical protein
MVGGRPERPGMSRRGLGLGRLRRTPCEDLPDHGMSTDCMRFPHHLSSQQTSGGARCNIPSARVDIDKGRIVKHKLNSNELDVFLEATNDSTICIIFTSAVQLVRIVNF